MTMGSSSPWFDVGRDDGAALGDLVAHELGRDVSRDLGAEAVAVLKGCVGAGKCCRAAHVFAVRGINHFIGDEACAAYSSW